MNAALDAGFCLLLLSAGVVGLVTVDQAPPATPGRADAVADALATTTAQVDYSLTPDVDALNASGAAVADEETFAPDSPEFDRTSHGSLAGLLARAATASGGVALDAVEPNATTEPDIHPLTRTRSGFVRAVGDAVLARTGARVRVDATWRPYPDAPVGGQLGVGPDPPAGRVHAASLVIPTGVEPLPPSARTDFDALGAAVADRTVAVLVPAGPARVTLRGDDPTAALVRHRYARLASATNASLSEPLATEDTRAANERVARRLEARFTGDLRAAHDTPMEAAEAVSVDSVRIVVRTWPASEGI
ncbi:DUF7284 family protein [Halobellus sp. EA9]|uniref:DUF7284 family protein n=1 Tax=Halobellus sp. EA9 TaxID=3421647 RepID=UPI003EC0AF2F